MEANASAGALFLRSADDGAPDGQVELVLLDLLVADALLTADGVFGTLRAAKLPDVGPEEGWCNDW